MIRAKIMVVFLLLATAVELQAAGPCPKPNKIESAASVFLETGLNNPTPFSIADRGAAIFDSFGAASAMMVGYARVQANAGGTTPSGYLIFSFHQNGVLVSEATVPVSTAISSGRIYAAVDGPVNTGLAIVNPNSTPANVSFYFTDANGQNFGSGSFTLPANTQIARFLNQAPFGVSGTVSGTMTFTSNVPVGVIALRGLTNERGEFLITTLPVADLGAAASTDAVFFPHYASGGGWTTEVILVNTTDAPINGTLQLFGAVSSTSNYSIAPRSMQRIAAGSGGVSIGTGAIRVTPAPGTTSPSGLSIFSFVNNGVTVSEAGVPVLRPAKSFRMFEIECGTYPGQLNTGIAIANPSSTDTAVVTLELTDLAGVSTGLTSTLTLSPNGQTAAFIKQLPGFGGLPYPFHGNIRISTTSPAGIAVVGLRGEYNERNDFLVTTSMPTNEASAVSSTEGLFPHFVDGAGYQTEFVLFSGASGQSSSGVIRFFTQAGALLSN